MAKIEKLVTFINTDFYDFRHSREILLRHTKFKGNLDDEKKSSEINAECKKISEKEMNLATLQDGERYFHIAFSDYMDFKRTEKDKLIFKIDNANGDYYISTGIYCGVINFGDKYPQLCIETGYSDNFFKRILNFCCGIYADTNTSDSTSESDSIYSLLIQYLFMMSLRKVAGKAIPKKYIKVRERGYDVKGEVDVEEFVNKDIISFDKKITYSYSKRLEIQPIVDVIYTALKCCKIDDQESFLPQITDFQTYIENLYSGVRPSRSVINNIHKDKVLFNGLYSDFKRPLEYAKVLIKNNDINAGGNKSINGVSGFLVDASFLWEMYLFNLMTIHLPDWYIESQSEISFYSDTFFPKKNYPDFVLRNKKTNKVFILDAKFKRMAFQGIDVDNDDIRQLHGYSYYYHLTEGDNFAGAGLIYPTKINRPNTENNVDNIYGVNAANSRFGVFSIKDPSGDETISDNEEKFISELKEFLGD